MPNIESMLRTKNPLLTSVLIGKDQYWTSMDQGSFGPRGERALIEGSKVCSQSGSRLIRLVS